MELIFAPIDEADGIDQFTMEVSLSDSVPQIKQKIQELKGIHTSRQSLLFVLPDDFNLRHSQIVDGSTIYLYLHDGTTTTTTTGRRQCTLLPSRRNTILHRFPSQQAAANQPPTTTHQQYPIRPTGGVETRRNTILHRSSSQQAAANQPPTTTTTTGRRQCPPRNIILHRSLSQQAASSSSSGRSILVCISHQSGQQTDTGAGTNQFIMEVSNSDTVFEIKQKIQQLKGILISRQTLRFNGAILAEDRNLSHSQIVDGSTIDLISAAAPPRRRRTVFDWPRLREIGAMRRPNRLVVVVPLTNGERCIVEVQPDEKAHSLRGKLVRLQFAVPRPIHFLVHGGKFMKEYKFFKDLGVEHGDWILLWCGSIM